MKRILTIALAAILVLALGTTAFAATTAAPTVTVDASAKIVVDPDIAYINLGVRTENKSAQTAKKENTALMTKVLDALKKAGVDSKDIETSSLSMYTNYSWDKDGNRKMNGYTVNNSITITVRQMDKVGDIVDAAMNAGANQFNNVSFALEDEEAYYVKALSEATKKAKKRASAIAAANGMTLGGTVSISSTGLHYNPNTQYPTMEDEVAEDAADMDDGGKSIGSTIVSGKITVTATVGAVYTMK